MADRTAIEWAEATWSPIRARWLEADGGAGKPRVGWHCERVSEGCRNCYAEGINRRLGTGFDFKPGHRSNVEVFLDETMLLAPLRWRRPRRIFVCSMTDLFADFVPDAMIDRVFAVMALAPQHTFQVLTKRPARMRAYLTSPFRSGRFQTVLDDGSCIDTPSAHVRAQSAICDLFAKAPARALNDAIAWQDRHRPEGEGFLRSWPLPNVWLGTSTEDQATADVRVPELLATPAAVRFVSAEPLLGPIDFTTLKCPLGCQPPDYCNRCYPDGREPTGTYDALCDGSLDWIIVGGESGPGARPMHPGWARAIRDQCAAAGVSIFFKQWGEWQPREWCRDGGTHAMRASSALSFQQIQSHPDSMDRVGAGEDWSAFARVGKKAAGRLLDGVTHDAMPEVRHG